jgi:hypothetical protein
LGGLFALIDTETGRLHQAYSKGKDTLFDENRQRRVYKSHPLTNAPIEGIVIPNWQSLCDNMTALHQKLSFIGAKFIAWDIALTNHGFCIIEGNASCSFDLVQGESGVRNQRIGQFFKSYNYIQ